MIEPPCPLRLQDAGPVLDPEEDAADEDRERVVPVLDRLVGDRPEGARDAGVVVEQAVEAPELADGEGEHRLDVRLRGDVGADEADARPVPRAGREVERLACRRLVQVGDHDARALLEEAERGVASDAASAARDDRYLAVEPSCHRRSSRVTRFPRCGAPRSRSRRSRARPARRRCRRRRPAAACGSMPAWRRA